MSPPVSVLKHQCPDWDYMHIGPGDPEIEACLCEGQNTGSEECVCGDYRRDHKDGVGPCRHNKPNDLCHAYEDCNKFRPSGKQD